MQQAIPYRNWPTNSTATQPPEMKTAKEQVAENAVVVFARPGCCMCHVVKLLLHGHGVNPVIFDVDERNEKEVSIDLKKMADDAVAPEFPVVFVGGKLFGGLEEVMGAHISGDLVPRLREARALWL